VTEKKNFALKIEKSCHVQNPAKILPKRVILPKSREEENFAEIRMRELKISISASDHH